MWVSVLLVKLGTGKVISPLWAGNYKKQNSHIISLPKAQYKALLLRDSDLNLSFGYSAFVQLTVQAQHCVVFFHFYNFRKCYKHQGSIFCATFRIFIIEPFLFFIFWAHQLLRPLAPLIILGFSPLCGHSSWVGSLNLLAATHNSLLGKAGWSQG